MAPSAFPETPRLFVDSSVIISGCASHKGASRALLTLGEMTLLQLVVSPFVLRETERNLSYDLSHGLPFYERIRQAINWEFAPDPPEAEARAWLAFLPPKDAPVLASAIVAKPSRFITLDTRNFLNKPEVANRSGLIILTAGDALLEIRDFLATGYGLG